MTITTRHGEHPISDLVSCLLLSDLHHRRRPREVRAPQGNERIEGRDLKEWNASIHPYINTLFAPPFASSTPVSADADSDADSDSDSDSDPDADADSAIGDMFSYFAPARNVSQERKNPSCRVPNSFVFEVLGFSKPFLDFGANLQVMK